MNVKEFQAKCAESDNSWGGSHRVLQDLVRALDLRRGVEIGLGYGGNAVGLCPLVDQLIGVDPFRHDPSYLDVMNVSQAEFNDIAEHVANRLRPFRNFTLLRMTSRDAIDFIGQRGTEDFVYIDGDHRAVAEDLRRWVPAVRTGGVIAGHDFDHPSHPTVAPAVLEFAGQVQTEAHYVWWFIKEERHERLARA